MSIDAQRRPRLDGLATQLGTAWLATAQIPEPAPATLPQNREEAYYVQDQMGAVIGEPLSGWKVGATSAKMRELDGHDDVIPGRIFSSVTYLGGEQQLPSLRFPNARAETEFAFRLQADCPLRKAPWTAGELAEQVTLHPAIEIIGNRHTLAEGTKQQKSLMTIADNGGGIGFVFGDAVEEWGARDFRNHVIRLQVDDHPAAENFLGDMRCEPLQVLADLLNHLATRSIGLKSGDFVSTGAATVPQPVSAGSTVAADFGELGTMRLHFS